MQLQQSSRNPIEVFRFFQQQSQISRLDMKKLVDATPGSQETSQRFIEIITGTASDVSSVGCQTPCQVSESNHT